MLSVSTFESIPRFLVGICQLCFRVEELLQEVKRFYVTNLIYAVLSEVSRQTSTYMSAERVNKILFF